MLQGVSVLFALRRAIDSVKKDLGVTEFYTLGNVNLKDIRISD